jgi:SAM-dependent methyltransferase
MSDARLSSPAVARNTGPILDVLRTVLPESGLVLEIASGGGEHAVAFARAFPQLRFQPSDPDPDARASVAAWAAEESLPNLLPPVAIDAAEPGEWPIEKADALIAINLVHISPWPATEGLFQGAARLLPSGAPLYLYGPYREADVPFAPSNHAFDESLRTRDPRWGVRDLDTVRTTAERNGFRLERRVEMPANNLSLVFRPN